MATGHCQPCIDAVCGLQDCVNSAVKPYKNKNNAGLLPNLSIAFSHVWLQFKTVKWAHLYHWRYCLYYGINTVILSMCLIRTIDTVFTLF